MNLSFDEKRVKFSQSLRCEIFQKLDPRSPQIAPIAIKYCNASEPCCFSDAFIEFVGPRHSYQFEVWFKQFYIELILKTKGNKKFNSEEKRLLEHLIDAIDDDQHLKCLQKLLTDEVKEAELTVLLALHYFKPLVNDCSVVIDNKLCAHFGKCQSCGEDATFADTSLGSKKVWHGRADILLHRSAVTVGLEKDPAEMSSSNSVEELDDLECGDLSETNVSLSQQSEDITDKNMSKNLLYQAISQGITNAFCQVRKNKALFNKFIPSFLVTQRFITIILYNCESDKLLLSEKFPIWESGNEMELDPSTVLKVWISLNYFQELDQTIENRFLQTWFPSSGFKQLVGEAYDTYLNEVQMPLDQKCKVVERADFKWKKLSSAVFDIAELAWRCDAMAEITTACSD